MRPSFLTLLFSVFLTVFFWSGCTTTRVIEDTRVPEITLEESGTIRFKGKPMPATKLVSALRSAGIRNDQEINILIPDIPDRAQMRTISGVLIRGGYTRMIFVTNRKATAILPAKAPR